MKIKQLKTLKDVSILKVSKLILKYQNNYPIGKVKTLIMSEIVENINIINFLALRGDVDEVTLTGFNNFIGYDAIINSGGTDVVIEAKTRSLNKTKYPHTELLNYSKFKSLKEKFLEGFKPFFINFYLDKTIVYDLTSQFEDEYLSKDDYNFITIGMPYTVHGYGSGRKLEKVRLLHTEKAYIQLDCINYTTNQLIELYDKKIAEIK